MCTSWKAERAAHTGKSSHTFRLYLADVQLRLPRNTGGKAGRVPLGERMSYQCWKAGSPAPILDPSFNFKWRYSKHYHLHQNRLCFLKRQKKINASIPGGVQDWKRSCIRILQALLEGSCHSARAREPAQPLQQIQEESRLLAVRRKITEKTPLWESKSQQSTRAQVWARTLEDHPALPSTSLRNSE